MNKHILLVMKWLNDKSSVTQDELVNNRAAAYTAAYAADAAAYAAYAYAAYAADAADAAAEKWVNKYFERTGEDKQSYINTLSAVPDDKPVFKGKLYITSDIRSCEDSIPHRKLALWLNPVLELIDGNTYQFNYNNSTFCGYFRIDTGRLYHSKGYVHNDACTNIKPLTVEVTS